MSELCKQQLFNVHYMQCLKLWMLVIPFVLIIFHTMCSTAVCMYTLCYYFPAGNTVWGKDENFKSFSLCELHIQHLSEPVLASHIGLLPLTLWCYVLLVFLNLSSMFFLLLFLLAATSSRAPSFLAFFCFSFIILFTFSCSKRVGFL